MAHKFGCKPSSWFPELEPFSAWILDREAFSAGAREEARAVRQATMKRGRRW